MRVWIAERTRIFSEPHNGSKRWKKTRMVATSATVCKREQVSVEKGGCAGRETYGNRRVFYDSRSGEGPEPCLRWCDAGKGGRREQR